MCQGSGVLHTVVARAGLSHDQSGLRPSNSDAGELLPQPGWSSRLFSPFGPPVRYITEYFTIQDWCITIDI